MLKSPGSNLCSSKSTSSPSHTIEVCRNNPVDASKTGLGQAASACCAAAAPPATSSTGHQAAAGTLANQHTAIQRQGLRHCAPTHQPTRLIPTRHLQPVLRQALTLAAPRSCRLLCPGCQASVAAVPASRFPASGTASCREEDGTWCDQQLRPQDIQLRVGAVTRPRCWLTVSPRALRSQGGRWLAPQLRLLAERTYTSGTERAKLWEEHLLTLRMIQLELTAAAEMQQVARRVQQLNQAFAGRPCLVCRINRPTCGSWFCSTKSGC